MLLPGLRDNLSMFSVAFQKLLTTTPVIADLEFCAVQKAYCRPAKFATIFRTNLRAKIMAELNELRAPYSVAISELRKAPMKVIEAAGDEAVAVLNHNAPVAYVVSPKMMGDLLDLVADKLAEQRALERMPALKRAKPISLADL